MHPMRRNWFGAAVGIMAFTLGSAVLAQTPSIGLPLPKKVEAAEKVPTPKYIVPSAPATILQPEEHPIDLASALRLAGAENPELLLARQRIEEVTAQRQLAVAQLLPNLNLG